MSRLNLNAGPNTKKKDIKGKESPETKQETKAVRTYLVKEDIGLFLTKSKLEIVNHQATSKVWIGAKDGGKTYPTIMDLVFALETDPYAHGFVMKKYKTGAASAVHKSVVNATIDIKSKGFKLPDYESGQNLTYRAKQRTRSKNQVIEYGSFEDYNSIAGLEAKNGGYFAVVIADEPVMMNDSENIPTPEEWNAQIEGIKDTITRSSDRYMSITGKEVPPTKYHYTMNSWDDHPIIVEAERVHPVSEFKKWVIQDVFNNTMKAIYNPNNDTLYVRNTKFDNPRVRAIEITCRDLEINSIEDFEEKRDQIDWNSEEFKLARIIPKHFQNHLKRYHGTLYKTIQQALASNDSLQLAIALGFHYEKENDNKVYSGIELMKVADTLKVLGAATEVSHLYIGIDVDYRRKIVITPGFTVNKQINAFDIKSNIVVGRQVPIATSGSGSKGEKLDTYVKKAADIIDTTFKQYVKQAKVFNKNPRLIIAVDDDSRAFVRDLVKAIPYASIQLAKKHDPWGIIKRQRWLNHAINSGWLIMDEENLALIRNLRLSTSATGQEKRDESGSLEKNYDEINSMEYLLWFLRNTMSYQSKSGEVSDYIIPEKEEG